MAGLTPIGQPAAGIPADGAPVDFSLGAGNAALAALLSEGAVVTAKIIGSNGAGQDLIELLGQRLIASLPPNLLPGEEILLQVVSVDGSQIVTRNLGPVDPSAAAADLIAGSGAPERPIPSPLGASAAGQGTASPAPVAPGPPAAPPSSVFVAASVQPSSVLEEAAASSGQPAQSAASSSAGPPLTAPPTGTTAGAAAGASPPPTARVLPQAPPAPTPAPPEPSTAPRTSAPATQSGAAPAPPSAPPSRAASPVAYRPPAGTPVSGTPIQSVEARIAAARAEATSRAIASQPGAPQAAPPRPAPPPPAAQTPGPANAPRAPIAPDTQSIINRLTIGQRDLGAVPPKTTPSQPVAPQGATAAPGKPAAPSGLPPPAQAPPTLGPRIERSPLSFGAPPATPLRTPPGARLEPTSNAPLVSPGELSAKAGAAGPAPAPAPPPSPAQVLLAKLDVPQTPATRAAADTLINQNAALPQALRSLDDSLASSEDPRAQTARAIANFVGDLDPSRPTLAAQLQAFIDHVVDGAEPKLATLLGAKAQAAQEEQQSQTAPQGAGESAQSAAQRPTAPSAPADASQPQQLPLPIPGMAEAHAAERSAALDHNLKNLLLSLTAAPPADASQNAASSIANALGQMTAAQLQTLQSLQATPNALTFAIPLPWPGGGQNAQLRIWKDPPDKSVKVSGDDFHIGFVLDTSFLGTVAVDLQAVGRGVKIAVKTEESGAATAFRGALSQLNERLEQLRYRVVSSDADVAPLPIKKNEEATAPEVQERDPDATVDLRI